jgi:hypothetical protein
MFYLFFSQSNTRVLYGYNNNISPVVSVYRDIATFPGILNGIGDEIIEQFLKLYMVCPDCYPRIDVAFHYETFLLDKKFPFIS